MMVLQTIATAERARRTLANQAGAAPDNIAAGRARRTIANDAVAASDDVAADRTTPDEGIAS